MALIPSKLSAGTTINIPLAISAYPAPTWSLTLYLRGPHFIDMSASSDGVSHRIAKTPAETETWPPGRYWWVLRATDGVSIEDVADGSVEIAPNLALTNAPYDGRSHARKVLDAIEAVIEGRATRDQQSYSINNRSLQRTPLADLLTFRAKYRAEVAKEEAKSSGKKTFGRMIKAVMP